MVKNPVLGTTGKQWLKGIHLTLSVIWLGAAISMNVLRSVWVPLGPDDLYAVDHAIMLIDRSVVMPAAFGALITGLVESWLTTWGFFKYRWVTIKLIAVVAMMLYAPFFQARWMREMEEISRVEGLLALRNPVYLQDRLLYFISAIAMIATLAALPIISVIKPWVKKDRENMKARAVIEQQNVKSGVSPIKP